MICPQGIRVTKKAIAVFLSLFLLLLAAGEVKRAVCSPENLNLANEDFQERVADSACVLYSAPVPQAAREEEKSFERVPSDSFYLPSCRNTYLPTSQGVPAKLGKDLLTFIEVCTI